MARLVMCNYRTALTESSLPREDSLGKSSNDETTPKRFQRSGAGASVHPPADTEPYYRAIRVCRHERFYNAETAYKLSTTLWHDSPPCTTGSVLSSCCNAGAYRHGIVNQWMEQSSSIRTFYEPVCEVDAWFGICNIGAAHKTAVRRTLGHPNPKLTLVQGCYNPI